MNREKVLIVGGAGYIGSHVNKFLSGMGVETIVYDNLSTGHIEHVKWGELVVGDLADQRKLVSVFSEHKISCVMHFAASAYVGESVTNPQKYYINNVSNTLNLLGAMIDTGVSNIVFSSSCAVYGTPLNLPITEESVLMPINPYGRTKLIIENVLDDYSKAYGLQYVALRYFNAAGADAFAEIGERHDPETHLIPNVIRSANGELPEVIINGNDYQTPDGSCIRDYIHVEDLASAHYLAMLHLNKNGGGLSLNLGTGVGYSVLEIVNTVEKIANKKINLKFSSRRDGDPPILYADAKMAKKVLNWEPKYKTLETILKTAQNWHIKKDGVKRFE